MDTTCWNLHASLSSDLEKFIKIHGSLSLDSKATSYIEKTTQELTYDMDTAQSSPSYLRLTSEHDIADGSFGVSHLQFVMHGKVHERFLACSLGKPFLELCKLLHLKSTDY